MIRSEMLPFPLQIFASWFLLLSMQELVEELGIYFLAFDGAGYGETDPKPGWDVKSKALDIEELTNQLGLR